MANAQISTSVTIIDSLLGFQAISLTAFDTASVPTIAAGSKVEIAGGFFSFSSAESINATSWSAITTGDTAYITLTPSGTAGSQILTAAWTSTAPEWSTSKQGYYTSAGSSVRVVGGCAKDGTSGSEYEKKWIYKGRINQELRTTDNPVFNDVTCNDLLVSSSVTIYSTSLTSGEVFTLLSDVIPDVGDKRQVTGSFYSSGEAVPAMYIYRETSTRILVYGVKASTFALTSGLYTDGSATAIPSVGLTTGIKI